MGLELTELTAPSAVVLCIYVDLKSYKDTRSSYPTIWETPPQRGDSLLSWRRSAGSRVFLQTASDLDPEQYIFGSES